MDTPAVTTSVVGTTSIPTSVDHSTCVRDHPRTGSPKLRNRTTALGK